jgi:hypothetical protein
MKPALNLVIVLKYVLKYSTNGETVLFSVVKWNVHPAYAKTD